MSGPPGRKGMSAANQKMAQVQFKIRQNAAEMQDSLKSLGKWEQEIKKKEKSLSTMNKKISKKKKQSKQRQLPAVRGTSGSTIYAASTATPQEASAHPMLSKHLNNSKTETKQLPVEEQTFRSPAEAARARRAAEEAKKKADNKTLDSHTYDKGYNKWEKFDVEAELAALDEEENVPTTTTTPVATTTTTTTKVRRRVVNKKNSASSISREELYKQDGNKHYKRGEFQLAIKCYTRCIAANPRNAVAYSNRAQAHVKLKNFLKAEEDCTSGILLNPQFVKSWSRRGTARNSLGRHRAALRDFEKALTLEPTNKKLHAEVRKTREAIKNCVRRTPRLKVPIREIGSKTSKWDDNNRNGTSEETEKPFGPTFTDVTEEEETKELRKEIEMEAAAKRQKQVTIEEVEEERGKIMKAEVGTMKEEEKNDATAEDNDATTTATPPISPSSDGSWVHVENDKQQEDDGNGDGNVDEDDDDDEPTKVVKEIPNEVIPIKRKKVKKKSTQKLYEILPKTSYEFLKVWRTISSDEKVLYINNINNVKAIIKFFKLTGIESDMLVDLISTCSSTLTHNKLLLLCDGLCKSSRFSTSFMFLEKNEVNTLHSMMNKMMSDSKIQEKFPKSHTAVTATNICEKIDGDCPLCPHPWLSGQSPVAEVHLSNDTALVSSAINAEKYLQQLSPKQIQRFDNPTTGLHTSLFYFCCHSTNEINRMKNVFRTMQWHSFNINYNDFSCNNDHNNRTVYLHALPRNQTDLIQWSKNVEQTMTSANITINHPRKSKFHMTLARVDPAYPITEAVQTLNKTAFGTHHFCSFVFEGDTYTSIDGC